MATLNELNLRIRSLKNTHKVTKTIKLVAASKMRRAQTAQQNAREYGERLRELISSAAGACGDLEHPLLTPAEKIRNVHLVIITSDRGLCGGFNNTLCRRVKPWLLVNKLEHVTVDMSFCGQRGFLLLKHVARVLEIYEGVVKRPTYAGASEVANDLLEQFQGGLYDEIYLVYNRFKSALSQVPTFEKLLPIEPMPASAGAAVESCTEYLFEPAGRLLADRLLPNAVRFRVYQALLENAAGEFAARMTAMDSASRNARDMIDRLTLQRNRIRQAAITKELIEIVTGAEALG